jgi:hypothetical protein
MKHRFLSAAIIGCLLVGLSTLGLFGQAAAPEVSLDDHPTGPPLMGPWVNPYMSAEDEFGLWLPASAAGFVGPSPTLGIGGFFDSDILASNTPPGGPPGFVFLMGFVPPPLMPPVPPPQSSPYYLDAISCDHSSMPACPNGLFVRFSVDRATGGITTNDASYMQAQNNEQPADIFRNDQPYAHVGNFVPLPPPLPAIPPGPPMVPYTYFYGGPINQANGFTAPPYPVPGPAGTGGAAAFNQMMYDHWGIFQFIPMPACPPITPGSHDNVDAFNEWPISLTNSNIYFCLHPADAIPRGFSPADIFLSAVPGGLVMPGGPFVTANQMGLDTYGKFTDSIDGLAFWDNNQLGVLEPGIDYAAFTLAPGSATLTNLAAMGFQVSAASVFLTDFQMYVPPAPATPVPVGFFYTWLFASDIGVGNFPNAATGGPLPVIRPEEINVDALDLTIDPLPVPYINPVTDPSTAPGTKKLH